MIAQKTIIESALLTASAAEYYEVEPNSRLIRPAIVFTNTTGTARLVTLYFVPVSGSASFTTAIALSQPIAPYETWECDAALRQILDSGATIWAACDSASAVSIRGSGILVYR